jgi:hypothetical protein
MSGRVKHLAVAAFIFMIGLLVFCCAILSLASGQLRANWFIYLVFGIIGAYVSAASGRVLFSAWKSPKFESSFPISLPNSVSIVAPCEMHGGKAVIYLASNAKLYRGEITLYLKQNDSRLQLGKTFLSGTKPTFRIRVPIWFKWLHVQEAGTTLDFWPKGPNRSFDPVIIPFTHTIAQGDTIELRIDVESVFGEGVAGKYGEAGKSDLVTVCFSA